MMNLFTGGAMTSPFSERVDVLMACRHILKSNGVSKKNRAFVMHSLGSLDDEELTPVYWALLHMDQRLNNLPTMGKPKGFSIGISISDDQTHITCEKDRYALCGVPITEWQKESELTPHQAHEHASCKHCQYTVKLYIPVFSESSYQD
jgi:hypothetical protein